MIVKARPDAQILNTGEPVVDAKEPPVYAIDVGSNLCDIGSEAVESGLGYNFKVLRSPHTSVKVGM